MLLISYSLHSCHKSLKTSITSLSKQRHNLRFSSTFMNFTHTLNHSLTLINTHTHAHKTSSGSIQLFLLCRKQNLFQRLRMCNVTFSQVPQYFYSFSCDLRRPERGQISLPHPLRHFRLRIQIIFVEIYEPRKMPLLLACDLQNHSPLPLLAVQLKTVAFLLRCYDSPPSS